jgi:hypothetical protein
VVPTLDERLQAAASRRDDGQLRHREQRVARDQNEDHEDFEKHWEHPWARPNYRAGA